MRKLFESVLKIESIEFCRMEQNEKGELIEDRDQITKLKANFIISAFGSVLSEQDGKSPYGGLNLQFLRRISKRSLGKFFIPFLVLDALSPVKLNEWNLPKVDLNTYQSSLPQVFVGGDLAGVANTTVESVNDGKTAAWYMHCYLQVKTNHDFKFSEKFEFFIFANYSVVSLIHTGSSI